VTQPPSQHIRFEAARFLPWCPSRKSRSPAGPFGVTHASPALIRDQQLANLFLLPGYMGLNIPTDKKGLLGRLFGRRAA
jgi:hypothetical protein